MAARAGNLTVVQTLLGFARTKRNPLALHGKHTPLHLAVAFDCGGNHSPIKGVNPSTTTYYVLPPSS